MTKSSTPRVLRITGVPPEMASAAVDALLTGHRGVLAIDAVESVVQGGEHHAVHVLVEETHAERVRDKLVTAFADAAVEDVTEMTAAGLAPSSRVRAGVAHVAPPDLALAPPSREDG
jgi:hypothetical protein